MKAGALAEILSLMPELPVYVQTDGANQKAGAIVGRIRDEHGEWKMAVLIVQEEKLSSFAAGRVR